MKRISLLSLFAVFFMAIGFTSCDTEPIDPTFNENNGGGSNAPANFQVNIGNELYQTTTTTAAVNNNILTLTATQNGRTFTITVPAARGNYTTPVLTYRAGAESVGIFTNATTTGLNGVVDIVSYNATTKKVSGTFNFTGYYSVTTENISPIVFSSGLFTNISFTDGSTTPTNPFFKVTFDGQQYNGTQNLATVGNGLITVNGFRGTNGEYVSIVIDAITEGTYTDDAVFAYSPEGDEDNVYSSLTIENAGTVTITEIDRVNHTISGTFSFRAVNQANVAKEFTLGEFNDIPYTENETTPSDDIFSATVDGTNFTYASTDLLVTTATAGSNEYLSLQGFNAAHEIRLNIDLSLAVGNHAFSNTTGAITRAYYTNAADEEFLAASGTLNITSKTSTRIAGTFNYTVTDNAGATHTVSAGAFDVEY
nr:DUF6252 family protein [uncultured Flavobacterium sp.]